MVDFTSALYLGQTYALLKLPQNLPLTTGKPAALSELALHRSVAQLVAHRQGLEAGVLAPSTLHLFWDIFGKMPTNCVVLVDRATYPVGKWGAMLALLKGIPVIEFAAHSVQQVTRLVHAYQQKGKTPWLLTDGWWVEGGKPAPLQAYARLLQPYNGVLLIDDTQAFGILGKKPDTSLPFGYGGGGSLPFSGLRGTHALTITSLSKGLGVPVAVLAGNKQWIARFKQRSDMRVHTSPVSVWHAWAADQVLKTDQIQGDDLRKKLCDNVLLFRRTLKSLNLSVRGGLFPVQKLVFPDYRTTHQLYSMLKAQKIYSLLLANQRQPAVPEVAFCIRADHTPDEIRQAGQCIRKCIQTNHLPTLNPVCYESLFP